MSQGISNDADRQRAEQARLLRSCLEEQKTPLWRDRKKMLAQERFGDYRSYVEAGFTESQALYMCQPRP